MILLPLKSGGASCSSCPENNPPTSSNKLKMLEEELLLGQDFATQLQFLLQQPSLDPFLADDLTLKILGSFNKALSFISSCESFDNSLNLIASSQVDSVCCDDRRSEDSGESRKRPIINSTKDKRGCYKRNRKNSDSWTSESATTEDGHAWRKYGQKEILNAKYPRSYFRCTHKYDQGCKATKQVQKMEEDSKMYKTTYIGHHTCKNIPRVPQMMIPTQDWESKIPSTIKQEHKEEEEEATPSDLTDNLSSLDSVMWKDLVGFESTTSPQSLDMDFMVKSIDFNTDFNFDETEFDYLR